MKPRTIVLVAAIGVVLTAGYAAAVNSQQVKMKTCSAEATQKGLKGGDRRAFMKTCLSSSTVAPSANAQQEKMKTCNKDATAKGLKGADRKTFMSSCLSGK